MYDVHVLSCKHCLRVQSCHKTKVSTAVKSIQLQIDAWPHNHFMIVIVISLRKHRPVVDSTCGENHWVVLGAIWRITPLLMTGVPEMTACLIANDTVRETVPHAKCKVDLQQQDTENVNHSKDDTATVHKLCHGPNTLNRHVRTVCCSCC